MRMKISNFLILAFAGFVNLVWPLLII
jgi:hypothetical protein